jgi:SpoVK/Ycf46/Vps4 family AAA+-type ATPase
LPLGVYTIEFSPFQGFFLIRTADEFDLPEKLYEIEEGFPERALAAFREGNRSLGVLLSGLKGAGKTVVAKQICNNSGLPVLVAAAAHPGIEAFLSELDCSCVIFMDEFEKVFAPQPNPDGSENLERSSAALLSLMDGATVSNPHLFVLTANEKSINPNLLDRPSRVRYVVEFGDLSSAVVEEIVDDLLADPAQRPSLLEWLSQRAVLSVDAVISVVREANRFGFDADLFSRWFNLSEKPEEMTEFVRIATGRVLGECNAYFALHYPEFELDSMGVRKHSRVVKFQVVDLDRRSKRATVVEYIQFGNGVPESLQGLEPEIDRPEFEEFVRTWRNEMNVVLGVYECGFRTVKAYHASFAKTNDGI